MTTTLSKSDLCKSQLQKFEQVLAKHHNAVIVQCGDEKTGARFGKASKRNGSAVKIGRGSRHRNGRIVASWQIWATWAPCDLAVSA
jgi:hypothetical protein